MSSGGMLTQKLNVDDLQFEKGTFDGTMAYAQNKVKETNSQQQHGWTETAVARICVFMWVFCVVILTEATDNPHREMGQSAQRGPLLLHAPGLGRHTRYTEPFRAVVKQQLCFTHPAI